MINTNFNSISQLLEAFPNEQTCIDYYEELLWNGNIVSPFDSTSVIYKCKGNQYYCKNTNKYFNVKTGTLFHNTKIALRKWFLAIWLVTSHKKGISSIQLGKDIGVTQKTAWVMLHKIRKCFGSENDGELNREVEMDETFVGGKNKHRDKNVAKYQGSSFKDKTPVLEMLVRGGRVIARAIRSTVAKDIVPHILKHVQNASVFTDEWHGYSSLGRYYENHNIVNHGEGQYVSGNSHTNTIEGFWSILKRGILVNVKDLTCFYKIQNIDLLIKNW